jgi:hypothetical protein
MARASSPALLALAAVLVALPVLALYPTSAGAQRSTLFNGDPCPTVLYANREQLTCSCGKTEGQHDVWGTDIYTDDSALCHAAKHFGAIDEAGGIIHVRREPGRASYQGSTRNGFTSADYGAWERSIVFDSADTVAKSLGGVSICPVQYNAGVAGWSGECRCTGGETGIVWGTDVYTSDSVVCRAARHAGAVGPNGGVVRVTAAPGQQSYAGSNRNGVQTDSYGSWPASFRVTAAGN